MMGYEPCKHRNTGLISKTNWSPAAADVTETMLILKTRDLKCQCYSCFSYIHMTGIFITLSLVLIIVT